MLSLALSAYLYPGISQRCGLHMCLPIHPGVHDLHLAARVGNNSHHPKASALLLTACKLSAVTLVPQVLSSFCPKAIQ